MGGVDSNSLINILETDDEENSISNQIIRHSPYYDIGELNLLAAKSKNAFSILSTNIQSINAKFDELKIFIENLKTFDFQFSAICLQESWLGEGADISQIQLEGYQCIPQGKSCSTKGGLIIYLQDKFDYVPKSSLTSYNTWEGQIIQVKKGKYLNKPINIGNIYRPPKDLIENYTEFIQEFGSILDKFENNNNEVIVTGDFNIDLLKVNEKQVFSEYFDMLTNHSFYPKITLPTRLSNKHGTLIDNFLCKLTQLTLDTTSGILIKKFSDHQPYFTVLNNMHHKNCVPKYVTISKQDKDSIQQFHHEILTSFEREHLSNDINKDPNINYNILHNILQHAKKKHIPLKVVKFQKHKHKKSPWITLGIIRSINFRDNLYKKHKMTDPQTPEFDTQKVNLKTCNTILKKSIRLAKKLYYASIFLKYKNDMKGTWKTISEILNKTKRKKSFPCYFRDGEHFITDQQEIANRFNIFFTNIGPNLSSQIKMPLGKTYKSYLTHNYNHSFQFQNIDKELLTSIIDKFAPKTSCGFDGISTKLIKTIKTALLSPLTTIINQMLNTGIFPDKLKVAKVIPIYKKDDETLFTNYRPISLLPAISKIFEKVIFKQLYAFFHEKKLFYNAQYGFRTEHSTEFAALELVDRVIVEMDKMNTPISIFLDLSKAFDTLDHKILLEKLKYYGITGVAHKLMESYVTDRKQYVEIDGSKSNLLNVTTGVPQGSILGPLLFIIYINDIINSSKLFSFIIYADDTTLSTTLEIVIDHNYNNILESFINMELACINDWLKANKLSLNTKKCKYMIFHTPRKQVDQIFLKIDNTCIDRVYEFNFLGLTINENLNWKSHTDKIANKISKCMGILNKLKHFLPLNAKVLIYNSLILSHLNFSILAWGYQCDRIVKLQKRIVRIISLSKYNAHTEPIFKNLKLLKIQDILKLQQYKFYYKFKNNKLPFYLQILPFDSNVNAHNHDTRSQHNIRQMRPYHEYARKCLRYSLPLLINHAPAEITDKIQTHSMQGFAGYIKIKILQSYQEQCTIVNCYICSRQ